MTTAFQSSKDYIVFVTTISHHTICKRPMYVGPYIDENKPLQIHKSDLSVWNTIQHTEQQKTEYNRTELNNSKEQNR